MTFEIKIRGASTGLVRHEYLCPACGRFERDVPRESVPDVVLCEDCGAVSPWSPSVVTCRVRMVEATRGKSEAKPTATTLDTRALAEGMPMQEWRAKRAAMREEKRRKRVREFLR